jgi:hypothetical protein
VTNREIRAWYFGEVAKIRGLVEEWERRGDSLETRARQAWKRRHDLRLGAREMMEDPADIEAARRRDLEKYGNPDGPTFEYKLEQCRSQGLGDDEAYRRIIEDACRTNEEVNKVFDL